MSVLRRPPESGDSRLTRPLQVVVAACSALFAIGSAVHGYVIVDTDLIEAMMRAAGTADPGLEAPGFTTGFRLASDVLPLPTGLVRRLEETLVRSSADNDLRRALGAAVELLTDEVRQVDNGLAKRLCPMLADLAQAKPSPPAGTTGGQR